MNAKSKTIPPTKDKVEPEKFNHLVAHARIQGIRLVGSRFDLKPEALGGSQEDWAFNITDELQDWHCENEAHILRGTYAYVAACVVKHKKLLTVSGHYLCTFRLSAVCDETAGRQFLERVGRFSAYPYFRSLFATFTQQSGLLLPPLPIISEQPRWVTPPAKDAGGQGATVPPSL